MGRICKFCGCNLPSSANYCGKCGECLSCTCNWQTYDASRKQLVSYEDVSYSTSSDKNEPLQINELLHTNEQLSTEVLHLKDKVALYSIIISREEKYQKEVENLKREKNHLNEEIDTLKNSFLRFFSVALNGDDSNDSTFEKEIMSLMYFIPIALCLTTIFGLILRVCIGLIFD